MKNIIAILVVILIVAGIGYTVGVNLNRPDSLGGNNAAYQIVAGGSGGLLRSYIASTTPYAGNEIFVGGTANRITLMLAAKASTTTGSLKIVPQMSRDCSSYYNWHGTATSTVLMASNTLEWYMPNNATTVTATDAWTFTDINAECMKFLIYQGSGGGANGNARVYGEAYVSSN